MQLRSATRTQPARLAASTVPAFLPSIGRSTAAGAPLPSRAAIAKYKIGDYDEGLAGPEDYQLEKRAENVMTGIVFSPQNALQDVLPVTESIAAKLGPSGVSRVSIGRMDYARKAEVAINEQINVELNMSYLYLSAAAYFGRDNVGLPGFSAHFKEASDEEREHALRLMEFQTRRGGRVVLASLLPPQTEFDHDEKGDALHAAEIALSLEKLNFGRLRELHTLADDADDASMTHFLEDFLIEEQSRDIKEAAVLVSQLQRAGKGLGVITVDMALQKKYNVQGAENPAQPQLDGNMAVTPLL